MINIKNLNKFNGNDEGVSPVIGVILMVAATIVIAGVIMAMLGGFAPVEPPRSVSVAVTHDTPTTLAIVFHGGPDGGMVNLLNITVDGGPQIITMGNITNMGVVEQVGNRTLITNAMVDERIHGGPDNDHVVVTARFTDGTHQVVLDTRV